MIWFTQQFGFTYDKGPRDWQNVFAIKKFRYIKVLFYILYYCWGEEIVHYTKEFVM